MLRSGGHRGPRQSKSRPLPTRRRVGDPPSGERPFDPLWVRNVDPGNDVDALMFIGDLFSQRLNNQGFQTLQDIITFVATHNKQQNTQMFKQVFFSQIWLDAQAARDPTLRCRGPNDWRSGRVGHRYSVRQYNYYGWNALREYLIQRITDEDERYIISNRGVRSDRIPNAQLPRGPFAAFPNTC